MTKSNRQSHNLSRDELLADAKDRSTEELAYSLDQIGERQYLTEAERLHRKVIIETLCQRHHEISTAYKEWSSNPTTMQRADEVVGAAAYLVAFRRIEDRMMGAASFSELTDDDRFVIERAVAVARTRLAVVIDKLGALPSKDDLRYLGLYNARHELSSFIDLWSSALDDE
ncbi:hypothetical protein OG874_35615 [Nocardia sp. NBC_00565]|uniref:hypothetical protein n=1 Tax=Nocardia sp. NBC_00565 TaxID=2975993 RepID=UPI002E812F5F|nr:hypothetical protein [Nocardia sp. NBC_00565]WUC02019.1 hypothetical protein OG874_35615 [Nocardia sp. NBC_00565]